jgi:hypothetical protein
VVNPSSKEVIAMKKLSVLILIAILGMVLWALPAGAEKIRMTDAELDGITAGNNLITCELLVHVPPPSSVGGIASAGICAGGTPSPPHGAFEIFGGTPKGRGNMVNIAGVGGIMSPPTGSFTIRIQAFGQNHCIGNCPP